MRILITGGCGFIGSHLSLTFAAQGHSVRVADNFDSYYDPRLKRKNAHLLKEAGILVHELDIAVDPLAPILQDLDLIIHAAAQPGNDANTSYFSYIKNNFHATVALVEALKGSSIRLVNISTSSIYGIDATGDETRLPAPVSPYGVTKLAAEAAVLSAVRRRELRAAVVRYFSVFGERERPDKLFPRLFTCLKRGSEFPLFDGSLEHLRSFTYVGDIVSGTQAVVDQFDKACGEIFNIGTEEQSTTAQTLEIAQSITGKTLKIQHLPPRPGDQMATHAQIGKAKKILGWTPKVSLQEGLARVWTWAQREL